MVAALAAMAAFMLIGSKPPAKPSPRPAEQPVVGTPSTGEATGSVIVNDCFEVGSDSCLTTHPKLQEALRILQSTSTGASLIENAAKEGISVRIGTTPPNALGVFRPSQRSVTLADRLAPMSPRGQAAVLAHELRHVANWSGLKRVFQGNSFSCYNDEASAFTTEVAVWKEIIGSDRPKDWLEREIDSLAHAMETRGAGFWLEMGSLYHNECGL